MEKGSETTPAPTPEKPALVTKFHIELDYDMLSSQLLLRSKAPTVVVLGILELAKPVVPVEIKEKAPGAARRIIIDYDMAGDGVPVVQSDCSEIIHIGILAMAHSMITQNQIMQRLQAMGAQARIVRPT